MSELYIESRVHNYVATLERNVEVIVPTYLDMIQVTALLENIDISHT